MFLSVLNPLNSNIWHILDSTYSCSTNGSPQINLQRSEKRWYDARKHHKLKNSFGFKEKNRPIIVRLSKIIVKIIMVPARQDIPEIPSSSFNPKRHKISRGNDKYHSTTKKKDYSNWNMFDLSKLLWFFFSITLGRNIRLIWSLGWEMDTFNSSAVISIFLRDSVSLPLRPTELLKN